MDRLADETGDRRFLGAAAYLAGDNVRHALRDFDARRRARRDATLRAMAKTFFSDDARPRQAQEIARRMAWYAKEDWPGDRHAARCPNRIADTIDGELWHLWKASGEPEILSERQLRRILTC